MATPDTGIAEPVAKGDLAREYERRWPGTGIPDAQKQERMERRLFYGEQSSLRRTGRTRGIVIPELPWERKENERQT
ncbi:MAG: hypothetical protein Q8R92_05380 [Deltaproteobacteria bacterium]|nr:hypothetical protein [Deltaproteobacteria bacterium]